MYYWIWSAKQNIENYFYLRITFFKNLSSCVTSVKNDHEHVKLFYALS